MDRCAHPHKPPTPTRLCCRPSWDPRPSLLCQGSGHHLVLLGLRNSNNQTSITLHHPWHSGTIPTRSFHVLQATHPLSLTNFFPIYATTCRSVIFHWDKAPKGALETAQQAAQRTLPLVLWLHILSPWPHLTMPPGVCGSNMSFSGFLWEFGLSFYSQQQPETLP